jgi:hypothetical protein
VGADGVLVEVHPRPEAAFSDGMQSLDLPMFEDLMGQLRKYSLLEGRIIPNSAEHATDENLRLEFSLEDMPQPAR